VRQRKLDLPARVNADLPLDFSDVALTSYAGLRTSTIDVDGVVVSTGPQVERAFRGYNPHHRKVPSYDAILAHVAETTHILRVKNRSGTVHDGKASVPFLRELWDQIVATLGRPRAVRFRMDGAIFRDDVLRWLRGRGVGYAIKVPLYMWLDLQAPIRTQRAWTAVAHDVSGFAVRDAITPWEFPIAVTIHRKKVRHRTAKNFQLDLFDPNDGYYEYSAVAPPDTAVRDLPSCRTPRAAWWHHPLAAHEQCPDARPVPAHRESLGAGGVVLRRIEANQPTLISKMETSVKSA
jgi:hypothetical protein